MMRKEKNDEWKLTRLSEILNCLHMEVEYVLVDQTKDLPQMWIGGE